MTVTINAASRELGISSSTLSHWAKTGRIKYERTAGGWRVFDVEEISRIKARMAAAQWKGKK